jgi:hypothetical protein
VESYIEKSVSNKIDIAKMMMIFFRLELKFSFVDNNPSPNTFCVNIFQQKDVADENNEIGKIEFE